MVDVATAAAVKNVPVAQTARTPERDGNFIRADPIDQDRLRIAPTVGDLARAQIKVFASAKKDFPQLAPKPTLQQLHEFIQKASEYPEAIYEDPANRKIIKAAIIATRELVRDEFLNGRISEKAAEETLKNLSISNRRMTVMDITGPSDLETLKRYADKETRHPADIDFLNSIVKSQNETIALAKSGLQVLAASLLAVTENQKLPAGSFPNDAAGWQKIEDRIATLNNASRCARLQLANGWDAKALNLELSSYEWRPKKETVEGMDIYEHFKTYFSSLPEIERLPASEKIVSQLLKESKELQEKKNAKNQ